MRGWGDCVRCGLAGQVPGPEKGKIVQEVRARASGWRPGSVQRLEEQVGFLEEMRWVNWHKGKVRGRCGKRKKEPRGRGWAGAGVNLSSLCSYSSADVYFCQFYINIYITSRLRDCIIYIYMEAGWNWGSLCLYMTFY